jgi:hypothetical protein
MTSAIAKELPPYRLATVNGRHAGGERFRVHVLGRFRLNWLGEKLDATKQSQVMFMDRDDILNLFIVTNLPLPKGALPPAQPSDNFDDDIPF